MNRTLPSGPTITDQIIRSRFMTGEARHHERTENADINQLGVFLETEGLDFLPVIGPSAGVARNWRDYVRLMQESE